MVTEPNGNTDLGIFFQLLTALSNSGLNAGGFGLAVVCLLGAGIGGGGLGGGVCGIKASLSSSFFLFSSGTTDLISTVSSSFVVSF